MTRTAFCIYLQPMTVKKEFLNYIHSFRGLAILFVVAGHLLLNWPSPSSVHLFMRVLWEDGTVLFVFIAGYLFQHLSKKYEYKNYLVKKLQNVIVPYLIVSTPIIVYRLVTNDIPGYILDVHPDFLSWGAVHKVGWFLLHGGHLQPLWFVPMITLFYVAAPGFIYIDRHPRWYWLLIPFCVLSFLVVREPFIAIPRMFVHFISVYLFGMFMSRYKKEYLEFAKRYYIWISVATVLAFTANLLWYNYNNPLQYLHKMLFCCFFMYWLWRLDRYVPKFFAVLADLSFGIFFIHYYVLLVVKALYEKAFRQPIPGNVVYWIIDLVLVMGGTVLFIQAVKRIFPKKSRYLIGC